MGKRKSPKKAPTPAHDEAAEGRSGSFPTSRDDEQIKKNLKKTGDDLLMVTSRLSSVEGTLDRLTTTLSSIQTTLEKTEGSSDGRSRQNEILTCRPRIAPRLAPP